MQNDKLDLNLILPNVRVPSTSFEFCGEEMYVSPTTGEKMERVRTFLMIADMVP